MTVKRDTLFAKTSGAKNKILIYKSKDLFTGTEGQTIYQFHSEHKGNVLTIEVVSETIQYGPTEMDFKTKIPLPKEKHAVAVDLKKGQPLDGKYDFGGGFFIELTLSGNSAFIQATDQDKEEIFAENDEHFYLKTVDATSEFKKENGKIIGMVLSQGAKYEGLIVE